MDKSEFFSDSILDFVRDKDEFEAQESRSKQQRDYGNNWS